MPSDEHISPISSIDKNSNSDSTASQFNVRSTTSESTIRQIDDKAKINKGPRGRILTNDEKLQRRLIANRKSAAASRSRRLNLIDELQKTVLEMSAKIEHLKRENYELRRELQMPTPEETFGGGSAAQGNNNVGHQGLMHLSPRGAYQPYIFSGSTSQHPSASQHFEGNDSFRGSAMQPQLGGPILLQDNIHGQQKRQHGYYAVSRMYPGEGMPSPSPFANSAPPSQQQQQQQQQHALMLTAPLEPLTGPIHSPQQGPPPPIGHFSSKAKGSRGGGQQEAV